MAAAAAMLFHAQHQCVLIAVGADVHDLLKLAARRAFVPDLVAAAAPIHRLTEFQGHSETLLVHVGQHQRLTSGRIHCHGGNQTVLVELRRKQHAFFHGLLGFTGGERDGRFVGHGSRMLADDAVRATASFPRKHR